MDVDVVFTRMQDIMRVVIFLRDGKGGSVDGSVAVVFQGDDAERVFVPAACCACFDPVYPSSGDNYVYRIEKGVYQASGPFSPDIEKIVVLVRCGDDTISREVIVA